MTHPRDLEPGLRAATRVIAKRIRRLEAEVVLLHREGKRDRAAHAGILAAELRDVLAEMVGPAWHAWAADDEAGKPVEAAVPLPALGTPIGAFVRERCEQGTGYQVHSDDLWNAWKDWCERHRCRPGNSKQMFGRNLRTAVPHVTVTRPRDENGKQRGYVYVGIRLAGGE